jgi:hypothetical protein
MKMKTHLEKLKEFAQRKHQENNKLKNDLSQCMILLRAQQVKLDVNTIRKTSQIHSLFLFSCFRQAMLDLEKDDSLTFTEKESIDFSVHSSTQGIAFPLKHTNNSNNNNNNNRLNSINEKNISTELENQDLQNRNRIENKTDESFEEEENDAEEREEPESLSLPKRTIAEEPRRERQRYSDEDQKEQQREDEQEQDQEQEVEEFDQSQEQSRSFQSPEQNSSSFEGIFDQFKEYYEDHLDHFLSSADDEEEEEQHEEVAEEKL